MRPFVNGRTRKYAAERGYGNNVVRGYPVVTVYVSKHSVMASTISEEAVAHALSMSPGDQDGLADFLTDYFTSAQAEELGKQMNKLYKFMTTR